MDKEHIIGRVENMKVNIIMDKNMEKVNITGILTLIMMENGVMECKMEKEF